ncbi:hypothetical protein FOQG_18299 [Fusarium oxysporum f. sp. raphani 54005]|uniref:SMP-30/Gluconolactonase/LRE-like region domain-containing protein n=2 Tax=Fusarium oxysporum f. sp. raphani TaxID=96318 RepID=X0BDS9_FUSOX|nr:hypothetical protein FOQG_18299 [Fusarium oxysporum f. sp. raphani 54005]KAG7408058.1 hypothetical protein Forpi1262_v018051 [Fusarium oxysporum f. sp. raphani]KAG7411624.1 hypothetical protein Forpi1262_v017511 [Fusarium oxysporum f. sp. raphani]
MLFHSVLSLIAFPAVALGSSFTAKTIGQLPLGTWLENVAVRSNGDLLVTELWPSATVYTVANPADCKSGLEELVTFPSITGLLGIAEVPKSPGKPETFIAVGSEATALSHLTPGTFEAWAIEFPNRRHQPKVKVRKISDMTKKSAFLNGVAAIPGRSDAVLVSDSVAGFVGRLDLSTGVFDDSAFVFPEMAPISADAFGINGIKVRDSYLYFTNSNAVKIYRIAITPAGYPKKGAKPQLVADLSSGVGFLDDFEFDTNGNIYAATNFDNSIVFVDVKTGKWRTVVGGIHEMTVAGSTAAAFSYGKKGEKTLYVSTSGALAKPVDGTKTEGAKVVAVRIRS